MINLGKTNIIPCDNDQALYVSMATRYRHDFLFTIEKDDLLSMAMGFTPEQRKILVDKMKSIYKYVFKFYNQDDKSFSNIPIEPHEELLIEITAILNDSSRADVLESIAKGHSGTLISAKQIYEEMSGEGFYNPNGDKSLYDVSVAY